MEFQEFVRNIVTAVRRRVGDEMEVEIKKVPKNNGLLLHGLLMKKKGSAVTPTLYLEPYYDMYRRGADISSLTDYIVSFRRSCIPPEDLPVVATQSFEGIKKGLRVRLVNYEMNRDRLTELPHERFLDLAVVYTYVIDINEYTTGSALIGYKELSFWGVSEQELKDAAFENMRLYEVVTCRCLEDIMEELDGETGIGKGSVSDLFVFSTGETQYGAAVMVLPGTFRDLAEKMQADLYIMPSSIHEVITAPVRDEYDRDYLESMVREINTYEVPPADVLSNHVYIYRRAEDRIEL